MSYTQQEEDPCSICGSADSKEIICSCSRCGVKEHMWCMRIMLCTIPDTWVCDECQIHVTISPMQDRGVSHPGLPAMPSNQSPTRPNMRKKDTRPGKVKFLPESEAVVHLPNDAKSSSLAIQNSIRKRYQHPSKKTPPDVKNGSPVIPPAPPRENRELKGTGKKKADTVKPSVRLVSFSYPDGRSPEKEDNGCDFELMENVQPKARGSFVKFTKNPVEADAIWSGQFEIMNDPDHGVYSELQAFTPRWVHRKAYFISLNLPSSLSLNFIRRNELWDKMFRDIPPNEDDVGLYIIPGNWERCGQAFKHLMETLDSRDYVMHASIDGVELIVFTSRWLEVDNKEPESQDFLWAAYRCVSPKYNATNKESSIAPFVNVKHVNADIDMVDGERITETDSTPRCDCLERNKTSSSMN